MAGPRSRHYENIEIREYDADFCDNGELSPLILSESQLEHLPGEFFSGYRYDLEPREEIFRNSQIPYAKWVASFPDDYELPEPEEFDPSGWSQVEDQSSLGSCQGHAASSAAEIAIEIATGQQIQLSRGFAYLASQEFDGLLGGDRGSTLSGGAKALARGIPLESAFPYVANYRELYNRYRQQKDQLLSDTANLYHANGDLALTNEPDCKKFLLSRSGTIEIGISWTLPDAHEIRNYRNGAGGGHAVCYTSVVKHPTWPYAYKLQNSWSRRWGNQGFALVHPEAVAAMLRARFTVFLGISGGRSPHPTPQPDL